jgi:hypothetical protein
MTAYSALLRLASLNFPPEAVAITAQHAKDDIAGQLAEFKAKWPHYGSY